jgi:hypothetical protein
MLLEEIARLRKSIRDKEPKYRVRQFYDEYLESYKSIRQPKKEHLQDFSDLFFEYFKYMGKRRC